jgi:alkanesulfonate monooxygenase SsuD/methylene tetrahydromethanopterin reductase-like flavin-dependent oxidoreductase (luciferase family)
MRSGQSASDSMLGRFVYGDPVTVAEELSADLDLGVDGFPTNMPANGHIHERVALLWEISSRDGPSVASAR